MYKRKKRERENENGTKSDIKLKISRMVKNEIKNCNSLVIEINPKN